MSLTVTIDGVSLSPELLTALGDNLTWRIRISDAAWERLRRSRSVIDKIVASNRTVYGINTGFGKFANVRIAPEELDQLQVNLITSHAAGVGNPLTAARTRRLLVLRINILCRGHSGIRPETVQIMVDAFNAGLLPFVPEKGTVGASGDLAPLSHLALGLMGMGKMCTTANATYRPADEVLREHNIPPIVVKAKEGLALINGTQLMTSLGCEAVVRARAIARQADIVMALSLEGLLGTTRAFHQSVHNARPHWGQRNVAARIRALSHSDRHPSQILASHSFTRVQDAYSLRCTPQVHGATNDIVRFVHNVLATEANCATDNPMIFPDNEDEFCVISAGNFHGEYPAKMLDVLAIGIHEIANISERRIERFCNPQLSGLPAFLTPSGGLNNGFMIAHCTAAALVSENKVLCHPSSVDSISTSAAQEDHVSMGGFAARKALTVVEHAETVVAIELLCACQAITFLDKRPAEPLRRVHELVRTVVKPWDKDRFMTPDIEAAVKLLREEELWNVVKEFIPKEHRFDLEPQDVVHLSKM